jgi:lipopolysaccharide/colanic/teichoic acid biosynthesis glycosyltransferase
LDRSALTKQQRWELADKLAEDRLPLINAQLQEAVLNNNFYSKYGKRLLDILVSGVALVVSLPINFIIGIGTFFDVGRPLFFKQVRTGKDGKSFTLIKFRNMKNTKDERGELLPPDKRVTKFGRFVRKTSLDELLNFWSIFKGDMSLIGPRPLVPEYTHRLNKRHYGRLLVRPGLECPPRGDFEKWDWQDQFDNDVWYVENISFKTDIKMLMRLISFALDREMSKKRGSAKKGIFMGYDLQGEVITVSEIPDEYLRQLDEE